MTRYQAISASILAAALAVTSAVHAQPSAPASAAIMPQEPRVPPTAPAPRVGVDAGKRMPATPGPAEAATGPSSYRSVFTDYRSYSEQAVLSWRESNALAGRIGGWKSYAREVQSGVATGNSADTARDGAPAGEAKPAASAARSTGSSGGHTGHSKP